MQATKLHDIVLRALGLLKFTIHELFGAFQYCGFNWYCRSISTVISGLMYPGVSDLASRDPDLARCLLIYCCSSAVHPPRFPGISGRACTCSCSTSLLPNPGLSALSVARFPGISGRACTCSCSTSLLPNPGLSALSVARFPGISGRACTCSCSTLLLPNRGLSALSVASLLVEGTLQK